MSAEAVAEVVGGVEVMAREVVAQRDRAERAEAEVARLRAALEGLLIGWDSAGLEPVCPSVNAVRAGFAALEPTR